MAHPPPTSQAEPYIPSSSSSIFSGQQKKQEGFCKEKSTRQMQTVWPPGGLLLVAPSGLGLHLPHLQLLEGRQSVLWGLSLPMNGGRAMKVSLGLGTCIQNSAGLAVKAMLYPLECAAF